MCKRKGVNARTGNSEGASAFMKSNMCGMENDRGTVLSWRAWKLAPEIHWIPDVHVCYRTKDILGGSFTLTTPRKLLSPGPGSLRGWRAHPITVQ